MLNRSLNLVRRFAAQGEGAAAVEFALLLPLMLTLYLGGVEVTQAVSADRKVTLISRTVADLTARASTVSTSDMNAILAAATAVAYPFPTSTLKVTVSSVSINGTGQATVDWSETLNGTKRSGDVTSSIPSALRVANTSLIWGEATYGYTPQIGYVITGTVTLSDRIFMMPRLVTTVTHT